MIQIFCLQLPPLKQLLLPPLNQLSFPPLNQLPLPPLNQLHNKVVYIKSSPLIMVGNQFSPLALDLENETEPEEAEKITDTPKGQTPCEHVTPGTTPTSKA